MQGKLIKFFSEQIRIKEKAVSENLGKFHEYPSIEKWLKVVGVSSPLSRVNIFRVNSNVVLYVMILIIICKTCPRLIKVVT